MTTRQLAEKYNTTRRALTFRLREINETKYEEIMSKRRILPPQPTTPIPEETWTQLGSGSSVRSIAREQNIHPSVLHNRLRQHPEYMEIMNQRRQNYEDTLQLAAQQFEEGQLLQNLSKIHGIDLAKLASEIQAILGPATYQNILQQRKHNPSNKISMDTIKAAAAMLEQGSKVNYICLQLNIHRKTLRRRLRQLLGTRYDQIIQRRRKPEKLIQEAARQFLDGESLSQLSKQTGIPLSTLHRRLPRTIGEDRYRNIMKERLLNPGFGTRGAARSKYETEIEQLLKKHGIPFTRRILPIGGHDYLPDFILYTDPPIIIEATGMNIDAYWTKYKHKLQHYLEAGYIVILIVPDTSVYHKALKYVPENVLIKLKDFKDKIESLKEAPIQEPIPSRVLASHDTFDLLVSDLIQVGSRIVVDESGSHLVDLIWSGLRIKY